MANEITPVGQTGMIDYGAFEMEAAQEERNQLLMSGQKFMKLEVGRNRVRFLPPPIGRRSPFVTVFQHFMRDDPNGKPFVFNCPRMMERKPCPACARADMLRQRGGKADLAEADQLWANRRVFANVINRKHEEAGPLILGFGKMIHEALLALRTNEDVGGDYTHPISGFDVVIERKGVGKNDTRYLVTGARTSTPLGNLEWLNTQPDLTSLAYVPSAQEILEAREKHRASQAQAQAAASEPASSFADDATAMIDDDDQIPF